MKTYDWRMENVLYAEEEQEELSCETVDQTESIFVDGHIRCV